jgi:hypothetical protein
MFKRLLTTSFGLFLSSQFHDLSRFYLFEEFARILRLELACGWLSDPRTITKRSTHTVSLDFFTLFAVKVSMSEIPAATFPLPFFFLVVNSVINPSSSFFPFLSFAFLCPVSVSESPSIDCEGVTAFGLIISFRARFRSRRSLRPFGAL